MKTCFKCNIEKPLSEFYKHKAMADGHLNKCKSCTKKDVRERELEVLSDPHNLYKERERHREKYHRLNYKEKHKPTPEKKKKIMERYKNKYPEKNIARSYVNSLTPKVEGNELHHWSYNEEHFKSVIELTVEQHNTVHRYLKYDQDFKMYRGINGNLLDTKVKHKKYCQMVINIYGQ